MELVVCPAFYPGAETICDGLPVLAQEGIRAVEIGFGTSGYFDCHNPDQIDKLVCTLARIPLVVYSIHAPFGVDMDFSSFDDSIHERGVDGQIEAIEIARLLGATHVIVHASDRNVGDDRKKRLDRARGVLRELSPLAEEADVKLAVENLPPAFLCGEVDELKWLVESIDSPSVGVCFDTGHANLTPAPQEWAERLLPLTTMLHLHDNDGTKDQHLFPGLGTVNWRNFTRTYFESNCRAAAALECPPPKGLPWRDAFGLLRGCLNI